jgi:hypothetical protein
MTTAAAGAAADSTGVHTAAGASDIAAANVGSTGAGICASIRMWHACKTEQQPQQHTQHCQQGWVQLDAADRHIQLLP